MQAGRHFDAAKIVSELMIRMLIIGYVFAIRSERQLCPAVQVNIATFSTIAR